MGSNRIGVSEHGAAFRLYAKEQLLTISVVPLLPALTKSEAVLPHTGERRRRVRNPVLVESPLLMIVFSSFNCRSLCIQLRL